MVTCCAANKCRKLKGDGRRVTYHRFPKATPERNRWIAALQRGDGWQLKHHHKLCSLHFEEAAFDRTGQTVRLREGAVPTIFNALPPQSHLQKVAKSRPLPRKRASPPTISAPFETLWLPAAIPEQSPENGAASSGAESSSDDETSTSAGATSSTSRTFHPTETPDSAKTFEPFHFLECDSKDTHGSHALKIKLEKSPFEENDTPASHAPTKKLGFNDWLNASKDKRPENAIPSSSAPETGKAVTQWLNYGASTGCLTVTPEISQSLMPSVCDHDYTLRNEALKAKLEKSKQALVASRKKVKILLQSRRRLLRKCEYLKKVIDDMRGQQSVLDNGPPC